MSKGMKQPKYDFKDKHVETHQYFNHTVGVVELFFTYSAHSTYVSRVIT